MEESCGVCEAGSRAPWSVLPLEQVERRRRLTWRARGHIKFLFPVLARCLRCRTYWLGFIPQQNIRPSLGRVGGTPLHRGRQSCRYTSAQVLCVHFVVQANTLPAFCSSTTTTCLAIFQFPFVPLSSAHTLAPPANNVAHFWFHSFLCGRRRTVHSHHVVWRLVLQRRRHQQSSSGRRGEGQVTVGNYKMCRVWHNRIPDDPFDQPCFVFLLCEVCNTFSRPRSVRCLCFTPASNNFSAFFFVNVPSPVFNTCDGSTLLFVRYHLLACCLGFV